MAIKKTKNLANGASGEYWKITRTVVDRQSHTLHCEISLFKDQAHCTARKPALGLTKSFKFQCTNQELLGDVVSLGYAKIKDLAATSVNKSFVPGVTDMQLYDADIANGEDV